MSVASLPFEIDEHHSAGPPMGLIVLSTDETLELDMRRSFTDHPSPIYVSRIKSADEVTHDNLSAMQDGLRRAADLLPKGVRYPVVGYGCTSASAVIGSERVEDMVQAGCDAAMVTNPLRATVAHAQSLGVSRFALLSPYIEEVNTPLRNAFGREGLSTDVFATFGESEERKVARISAKSLRDAAIALGADPQVEAVFMSCTNLRTLDVIPHIEQAIGKPVLSSNRCLAWHMREVAGR